MVYRRAILIGVLLASLAVVAGGLAALRIVRRLDAVVVEKFNGRRWNFPSRVYSDAFLLYPGLDLKQAGLTDRLQRLNYQETTGESLQKGNFRRTATGLDLFLRDFSYPGQRSEDRLVHLELAGDVVTGMRDLRNGEPVYSLQLEPELISGLYQDTWEERREVSLNELPPLLVHTLILTEDRRFYAHHGFDPKGIMRALLTNVRSGEVQQGGSTLTQQLVKNFFLTDERHLRRKITEATMAVLTERRYSKTEILETYLNEIYFGQNGLQGIYGVWEAAEFYFARPPRELSVGDIALLVGLIRAPNALSPFRNPDRARARRDTVLALLRDDGVIDETAYTAAIAEPLHVAAVNARRNAAPYFVDFLRDDLSHNYPSDLLTSEGLGIFTSLDVELQQFATAAIRDGLAALERDHPALTERDPDHRVQAALIAVRPQTGAIVAMVGGRDYEATQFNRAAHAHRQPGSIFKPFVFLAAFQAAADAESPLTPTTSVLDEPFAWPYDRGVWKPSNFRDQYFGPVTARRALELSLNAATSRIAHDVGLEPILEVARRSGIESPLPPYPSVVLGSVEVTPLEIAQAYAVIANQGVKANLRAVSKVVDRQGQLIERRPMAVDRAVSPPAAYLVTHLMEGVLDRGTGRGVRERGFARPAAGKTGTTNDGRDAWFAGFTPDLLAIVWVGFDDGPPIGLTGAEAALPIWTDFMQHATAATPPSGFRPPSGVALVRIDPYTGGIATPACRETILEAFLRGQEPTVPCPLHAPRPAASEPAASGT